MGNQLAVSGAAATVNVSDISPTLSLVAPLGGAKRGRLFASLHCRQSHSANDVVVKVFVQRTDDRVQAMTVARYQDTLQLMEQRLRRYFREHPAAPCNVLFYGAIEKHRAGSYCLLQRPFLHASLPERLQMRPFWDPRQRLFACYQLLQALQQLHDECRCVHGDLKPENVLLTTNDWLFIADISPYKPAQLPSYNPANFEYFYDTAETRNCCCAPEKFVDMAEVVSASPTPSGLGTLGSTPIATGVVRSPTVAAAGGGGGIPNGTSSTPGAVLGTTVIPTHLASSDVFSAACVMVFILTDEPLFKLSGALDFRQRSSEGRREFLVAELVGRRGVSQAVVDMLCEIMCAETPGERPTAKDLLRRFTPSVFPRVFGVLHANFIPALLTRAPDAQIRHVFARYEDMLAAVDRCSVDADYAVAMSAPDTQRTRVRADTTAATASPSAHPMTSPAAPDLMPDVTVVFSGGNTDADLDAIILGDDPPHGLGTTMNSGMLLGRSPLVSASPMRSRGSDLNQTDDPPTTLSSSVAIAPAPVDAAGRQALATLLLPTLVLSARYTRATAARALAMVLLRKLSQWASEHSRRHVMLPWARQVLLSRRAGLQARVQAVRTMSALMAGLPRPDPKELYIMEDYVLDAIETVVREPAVVPAHGTPEQMQPMLSLLAEIAAVLPGLLEVGCSYVRQRQGLVINTSARRFASYDAELREVVDRGWDLVKVLLSTGHAAVQCALIGGLPTLCRVLGEERASLELMPILTTLLSTPMPEVKAALLRNTAVIAATVQHMLEGGAQSMLLTMILEDGVRQADPTCVCAALQSTTIIATRRILPPDVVGPVLRAALVMLPSRNAWVRAATCAAIEAVARAYTPAELLIHLAPAVRPHLARPVPLVALTQHAGVIAEQPLPDTPEHPPAPCADFLSFVADPSVLQYPSGAARTPDDPLLTAHVDVYEPDFAKTPSPATSAPPASSSSNSSAARRPTVNASGQVLSRLQAYRHYRVDMVPAAADEASPWRLAHWQAQDRERRRVDARTESLRPEARGGASRGREDSNAPAAQAIREASYVAHWDAQPAGAGSSAGSAGYTTRSSTLSHADASTRMSSRLMSTPHKSMLSFSSGLSGPTTAGAPVAGMRPTAAPLGAFTPNGSGAARCLAAAGHMLLCGGDDGAVLLWDADAAVHSRRMQPQRVPHVVPSTTAATCARFAYDAVVSPVCIGSADGTARLFDPQSEAVYASYNAGSSVGGVGALCGVSPSVVLAATDDGSLTLLDWRVHALAVWRERLPLDAGYGRAMAALRVRGSTVEDACAVVVGTSAGRLLLFDMRFHIPVADHALPGRGAVCALCADPSPAARPDAAPLVVAAQTSGEVLRLDPTSGHSNLSLHASAGPDSTASSSVPRTRALLPLPRTSQIITGGSDCILRRWDLGTPGASRTLGTGAERTYRLVDTSSRRAIVEHVSMVQSGDRKGGSGGSGSGATGFAVVAASLLPHHDDVVTGLAAVRARGQMYLASCARSGVVKLWHNEPPQNAR